MNKEKYIRMRCDDITLNTFIGDTAVLRDNKQCHGPMLTHISPPPLLTYQHRYVGMLKERGWWYMSKLKHQRPILLSVIITVPIQVHGWIAIPM